MKALDIYFYASKSLFRSIVRSKVLRLIIVLIAVLLFIGGVFLGITFGFNPPPNLIKGYQSSEFINKLSGLFALFNLTILFLPTWVTSRGALKLIENPNPINLMLTSPVSPSIKFWSSIAPLIFFSSLPFILFITPFLLMFIVIDPMISLLSLLYLIIISSWSVVLTFAIVTLLVNWLGKVMTSRVIHVLPAIVFIVPYSIISSIEDIKQVAPILGYWQIIFFGVSAALLPPIFYGTCKAFYTLIVSTTDIVTEYKEPKWGSFNPWNYLERRAVSWSILPVAIYIILDLAKEINIEFLNEGILSFVVFLLVTSPVSVILQSETIKPDRLSLAPYAREFKKSIWIKLCLPLFTIGIAVVLIHGINNWLWMATSIILLLLGLFLHTSHYFCKNRWVQTILYSVLMFLCFFTQFFWFDLTELS